MCCASPSFGGRGGSVQATFGSGLLQLQLELVLELADRGEVFVEARAVGRADLLCRALLCSLTADSTLLRTIKLGSGLNSALFGSANSAPNTRV